MSTAIATLPRAGGNGAALVVVVADLLMGLCAAATVKAPVKANAVSKVGTAKQAKKWGVWQLYRLTSSRDSVNLEVQAALAA